MQSASTYTIFGFTREQNLSKQKSQFIDTMTSHVRSCIKEKIFDKNAFFEDICTTLRSVFQAECAIIHKDLHFLYRDGFSASPSVLNANHKSIDPQSCLTKVIPLIKRAFTQKDPVVPQGKNQEYFHLAYNLTGADEIPNVVLVAKFQNLNEEGFEDLKSLQPFLCEQMYIFDLQQEESVLYKHYFLSLQKVLQAKSVHIFEHCERVSQFCKTLGALCQLNERELELLGDAALVHDIGLVHVPNEIINRQGNLTQTEILAFRKSVEESYKILSSKELFEMENIAKIVLNHQENFDGSGYPKGIKGNAIPRMSRILCIANAYDAMTSPRIYKRSLTPAEAMEELKRCSGHKFDESKTKYPDSKMQFDPEIVKKFVSYLQEWA